MKERQEGSDEDPADSKKTMTEKQEGPDEEAGDSTKTINSKKKKESLEKEKDQDTSDKEDEAEDFSTSVSNEDKSVLMTVFMENINSGTVLTLAEVRFRMRSVPYLRRFVLDKAKTKKFYDFVRYKTLGVRETSDTFGKEDEFEFVTSLSSSQRKAWEAHDTYNIEEAFSSFKSMPTKNQVVDTFSANTVLRHILSREGKNRCYEKVKALFKKRADK